MFGCDGLRHREFQLSQTTITLIFNGLKIGKVFKSNTWLLILYPEVAKLLRYILISLYYGYISLLFNFYATSRSSINSQVLDLKTLPIFSPLKLSVNLKPCVRLSLSLNKDLSLQIPSATGEKGRNFRTYQKKWFTINLFVDENSDNLQKLLDLMTEMPPVNLGGKL